MQNLVVIGRAHLKPEHCQMWSNFEFDRNLVSGTGARRCQYCINKTKPNRQCACFTECIVYHWLSHWHRCKMAPICRDIFFHVWKFRGNGRHIFAFSQIKRFVFWLRFHWNLFQRVLLTIRSDGLVTKKRFCLSITCLLQYLFCIYSFAQKNKEKRRDVLLSAYVLLFVYLFSTLLLFRLIRQ